MHSKTGDIEIMMNDEADEVVDELFESLKKRYQISWKNQWKIVSLFDYVHLFYYKCHKINPNWDEPYTFLSWLDKKQKNSNKSYQ